MSEAYRKALKKKRFEGLTIHITVGDKPMSVDPKSVDMKDQAPEIPGIDPMEKKEEEEEG